MIAAPIIYRNRPRSGFTLLEVLLALALTMVVLTIVFSAIYQYMFVLTRQQAEIERKQVARGVMQMISDDLAGAIQYKPEDYSALENLVESQSLAGFGAFADAGGENIDADALEQEILGAVAQGNSMDGESGDGDTDATSDDEEGETEEVEELGRPTLIGNNQLLRVDTSRLPRIDQYNPLVARRPIDQQLPSDVKTVTYFFSDSPPTVEDKFMPDFGRRGGLYRRRIDRAVEALIGDENVSDKPDDYCELIAPEVVEIKFRYFDGTDWQDEWESEEQNGFPPAIEIVVTMDPQRALDPRQAQAGRNPEELEVLRSVVYLPVAEILPEENLLQGVEEGGESDR